MNMTFTCLNSMVQFMEYIFMHCGNVLCCPTYWKIFLSATSYSQSIYCRFYLKLQILKLKIYLSNHDSTKYVFI